MALPRSATHPACETSLLPPPPASASPPLAVIGVVMVVVIIPCIATQHSSADWVFRHFETEYAKATTNINNDL